VVLLNLRVTGVYGLCDGPKLSRGPYLSITMICSVSSLIYVSLKAAFVFGEPANVDGGGSYFRAAEVALFLCSSVLAIGHIVVAYRTSCKERRKLLVFKIDIEAVSLLPQPLQIFTVLFYFNSSFYLLLLLVTLKDRANNTKLHYFQI